MIREAQLAIDSIISLVHEQCDFALHKKTRKNPTGHDESVVLLVFFVAGCATHVYLTGHQFELAEHHDDPKQLRKWANQIIAEATRVRAEARVRAEQPEPPQP